MSESSTTASSPASKGGLLHLYAELWRFAAGHRTALTTALGFLLASQLIKLVVPYFSGRAIDTLQLEGLPGLPHAGWWLLAMFGATLASWLLHGPGRVLERNVALTVRSRVSGGLVDRLLSLPLAWHEGSHSGASAHRVNQSTHALYDFAQTQFIYLQSAVMLVGPIVALWLIEPFVGLAALVGLAAISFSITGFDRAMIRLAHRENDAERRYSASLLDALGNITSVFALRQKRGVAALIQRRLTDIYVPLKRSIVLNEAKWCSVDLLSQGLSCALLALFAWMAARGLAHSAGPVPAQTVPTPTLPLGNIYMVWQYALQAGGVISAVAAHFQTFARQQADYASGNLIRDAEAAHFAAPAETGMAPASWQQLQVRDLTFRHARAGGSAPALDRLEFTLERGKRYALIGGSGSGKSTLLRVLSGLYLPEAIAVVADGRPALDTPLKAAALFTASATLIPQDAEVFEGSLAENLALCESVSGAPDVARFPYALQQSCAADFIPATPTGLAMQVAERGANWSGGQRQRVALARGILAAEGSALILLDEPTAALDPSTERRVYENFFTAFPQACIVSSVHRLNLLDRFDEVLVMQNGRLLDRGSVAELTRRSPEFVAMMAAQRREPAAG